MFNNNLPFPLSLVPKAGVQQSPFPLQLSELELLQLNLLSKQTTLPSYPSNVVPQILTSFPQGNMPFSFSSPTIPNFANALMGLNYLNSLRESNLKLRMLDQSFKGVSLDKLMLNNLTPSVKNTSNTALDLIKNFKSETTKLPINMSSSQQEAEPASMICKARKTDLSPQNKGLKSEEGKVVVPNRKEEILPEPRRKIPSPKENVSKVIPTSKDQPSQAILGDKPSPTQISKINSSEKAEVKKEKRIYRKSSDRIKRKLVKQLAITKTSDDSRPLNQLQMMKISTDQRLTEEKKKYDTMVVQNYLRVTEKPEIKVGKASQANIPTCSRTSNQRKPKEIWNPNCYGQTKEYLDMLETLLEGSLIEQKALRMLKIKNFEVDSVVKMIKKKRIYFKSVYTAQVENEKL